MDQLVLIKSAHKIERTPGSRLQGGVHCQEAQIDSITLHIHQITPEIARSSLRRVGPEIVIPVQSQINIMIPLLRAALRCWCNKVVTQCCYASLIKFGATPLRRSMKEENVSYKKNI